MPWDVCITNYVSWETSRKAVWGEVRESVTSISKEARKLPIQSSPTCFSEGEGERAPISTRWVFSASSSEYSGREGVKIFSRWGVLSRRSGRIHTLEAEGKSLDISDPPALGIQFIVWTIFRDSMIVSQGRNVWDRPPSGAFPHKEVVTYQTLLHLKI